MKIFHRYKRIVNNGAVIKFPNLDTIHQYAILRQVTEKYSVRLVCQEDYDNLCLQNPSNYFY